MALAYLGIIANLACLKRMTILLPQPPRVPAVHNFMLQDWICLFNCQL